MINIKQPLSTRTVNVILIAAILTGTVLRFAGLGFQSLWYDELHSIIPTAPENSVASIIEYCKADQPPAFFLYLHFFFKVFGYSDIIGRAACALLGIVSIPVCYWLGKELGNRETGLMAAWLIAVNYFHIYYSQELRFYSMLFLFTSLSYLFFIRVYKTGEIKNFAGYILATATLLYTHYFGLIIFAVQVITFAILALYFKREKRFIAGGILSGLITALALIPWVPVIINDLGTASFWIKKPNATFIFDYFYSYFGKDVLTTVILVVLTVFFVRSWKHQSQKSLYVIPVVWLIASYLIPYIKSITGVPLLHVRYTIISLPAWIMIFALGWDSIQKASLKYALPVVIALAAMVNLVFFREHYSKITKQQFRESSYAVQQKNGSLFPIFSNYPWHFNHYFRDQGLKVTGTPEQLTVKSFWVLQAELFGPEANDDEIRGFSHSYHVEETYPFNGTRAILMTRNENLEATPR